MELRGLVPDRLPDAGLGSCKQPHIAIYRLKQMPG